MRTYETPPYYITAYGLAVKRGFKGTEEEWLASLRAHEIEIRYQDGTIQWRKVSGTEDSEEMDGSYGYRNGDQSELYQWRDLIDIAGIRGEAIDRALEDAQAAAQTAMREAAAVEGTRQLAEDADRKAQQAMETANNAKQVADTALASAEGAANKSLEALRIANDVAQEMQDYSPSGTRSIAESAMRTASSRLVAPPSASVGQYFRVASVDANGMVTEVEAVDAPGSGNGSDSPQNVNGLSTTAANLLITILRNGVYGTDQSTNITALESALGGSGGGSSGEVPDIPDVPVPDEPDEPGNSDIDIPTDNLMGYYDMRTALTEDNYITDLSGNGRDILFYPANGYYENGVLYRGDKANIWSNNTDAYSITDGANGKYSYGENVTMFVTISGYTAGTTPLMNTGNSFISKQIIAFRDGAILYSQSGFNNVASDTKMVAEELTTICAVISPGEEKIFVNGVLKNTSEAKGGNLESSLHLLMGYESTPDADTKIHNAAVYNAALTDSEVSEISAILFSNAGGVA